MKRLYPALTAALVILLVATTCASRNALADRDARLDSLRTETLQARASAMGWETRLVEAQVGLERRLQEAVDSTDALSVALAGLARENELLGGELRAAVRLNAEVAGSIEHHDATVHTSAPDNPTPDSVTVSVDDGLLSGRLVYRPPSTLAIDPYRVQLELVGTVTEAPDGRALFGARAADPRVTVSLGEVWYQPPVPVQRCGFNCQLKAAVRGYVALRGLEWALAEVIP